MPRRRCCGLIEEEPICPRFGPHPHGNGSEILLKLEEYEALRLKDHQGLDQQASAEVMGLTRTTFQRILQSARTKIATALVEGKMISIQGGDYQMKNRVFECAACGHNWEEAPCSEGGKHGYEIACPQCGSKKKFKLDNGVKQHCGGGGPQHGNHHHGGHEGGCCGGH